MGKVEVEGCLPPMNSRQSSSYFCSCGLLCCGPRQQREAPGSASPVRLAVSLGLCTGGHVAPSFLSLSRKGSHAGEDCMHRPHYSLLYHLPAAHSGPAGGLVVAALTPGLRGAPAHTQLPAGTCFHTGTYLSRTKRASLRTGTDGHVSAGGLAFPQAVLYPHGQAEAASVAARVVCLSAALLKLWFGNRESRVDFRVCFFPSPFPVVAISNTYEVVNFFCRVQ